MTECTMRKTTSGTYKFSATYVINAEYNGIEISFSDKPGDIIRDELKKHGFRWHKAKKVWYAKNTEKRLGLAERLANRENTINEERKQNRAKAESKVSKLNESAGNAPLVIPSAKFVDGGGLYDGWEGGNNKNWHSDQELKALLLADFKKAGISATVRFGRGGYTTSLTVTIKISMEEIASYEEFSGRYCVPGSGWLYYTNDSGKLCDIFSDTFWSMEEAERDAMQENITRTAYNLAVKRLTDSGACHSSTIDVLTEAGNAKYRAVQAIVDSYNRDCSNSMVDYFDRDIYDHYTFKVA